MRQIGNLESLPTKSRDWIEAECLRLAMLVRGGAAIQRVMIRRLHPADGIPNWKAADIIPLPDLTSVGPVRAALARLPGMYALEDD